MPKRERILAILALAVLLSGTIFSLKLFFRNSAEVQLGLRESFFFKDYEIKVEEINTQTCVEIADFDCKTWAPEANTLLRITNQKTKQMDFLNLGEATVSSAQALNLQVDLQSIDLANQTVSLKLSQL